VLLPPEQVQGKLPSWTIPSDHVALVVDFALTTPA
jgi:hypothetical protein